MAKTDYSVVSDSEIVNATENRIRQLESEHYAQTLLREEMGADPHSTDLEKEQNKKSIESLEARLTVLRQRHSDLKANTKAKAAAEGK